MEASAEHQCDLLHCSEESLTSPALRQIRCEAETRLYIFFHIFLTAAAHTSPLSIMAGTERLAQGYDVTYEISRTLPIVVAPEFCFFLIHKRRWEMEDEK